MSDTPDDKLKSLDDRIEHAQKTSTIAPPPAAPAEHDNPGMRAGSEFLAHVVAGAVFGWVIDHFAGTMPWGIVVMVLLGFGLGIYRANNTLTGK